MKYGGLTLGQIEAMVNKLGGMEGVRGLLSGDLVVVEAVRRLKTWKTIKLGTGGLKTAGDFRRILRSGKFEITEWTSEILGDWAFEVADEETEVDLVRVTVGELGFREGARLKQLYGCAQELGFQLCPPEVGPQLRLQYKDQPKEDSVFVGMEPIAGKGGGDDALVFTLRHINSILLLDSYSISNVEHYNSPFRPELAWVFVRPRE